MFPESDDDQIVYDFLSEFESQQTIDAYARDVHQFRLFIAPKALYDVSLADLRRWQISLERQGLAPATLCRKLGTIRSFYKRAWQDEKISVNPAARLKPPKQKIGKTERYLSPENVKEVIAASSTEIDRLFVRTLFVTACRISECVGIHYEDLMPGKKVRLDGKGGKVRIVAADGVFDALCDRARDVGPGNKLFPIGRKRGWEIVRDAAAAVGLEGVSPHWLRHSHASIALANGCDIAALAHQLGHSSTEVTAKYYIHHDSEREGSPAYLDLD